MVPLNIALQALWNSPAIWRGYIDIPVSRLESRIADAVRDVSTIHEIKLKMKQNHVVIDTVVGGYGLRFRWTCSFALRAANLNKRGKRYVTFEASPTSRVGPANWAARAARFSGGLIPGVGMILGIVVKAVMDFVAKELVESQVAIGADRAGVLRTGRRWTALLNEHALSEHPLFRPIELSDGNTVPLVGGIVLVQRLLLDDDKVRVFIDVKPELKESMKTLQASGGRLLSLHWSGEATPDPEVQLEAVVDDAQAVDGCSPTSVAETEQRRLRTGGWNVFGVKVPEVAVPVPAVDKEKMVEAGAGAGRWMAKAQKALAHEFSERKDAASALSSSLTDFDTALVSSEGVYNYACDPVWASVLADAPLLEPLELGLEGAELLDLLEGWLDLV